MTVLIFVTGYHMLPPSWGGELLGGMGSARLQSRSVGMNCTNVQMLFTWNALLKAYEYTMFYSDVYLLVLGSLRCLATALLPYIYTPSAHKLHGLN